MTDNEHTLIKLIRENDDPEKALDIAFNLLLSFLASREVPQDTSSATPRATA